MMSKKLGFLVSIVLVLGLVSNTLAINKYWDDGGDPDELWSNGDNWYAADGNFTDQVPTIDDILQVAANATMPAPTVLIDSTVTASARTLRTRWSTINMTGGTLSTNADWGLGLDMGWGNADPVGHSQFNMSGGTINNPTKWRLGEHHSAEMHMTGGVVNCSALEVSFQGGCEYGHLQLDGGVVNVNGGRLWINSTALGGTNDNGSIDIEGGVIYVDDADGQKRLDILQYVDAGILTGYGSAGNVFVVWDSVAQKTTVSAPIPEPATMMLLGLGGLALIRRKR